MYPISYDLAEVSAMMAVEASLKGLTDKGAANILSNIIAAGSAPITNKSKDTSNGKINVMDIIAANLTPGISSALYKESKKQSGAIAEINAAKLAGLAAINSFSGKAPYSPKGSLHISTPSYSMAPAVSPEMLETLEALGTAFPPALLVGCAVVVSVGASYAASGMLTVDSAGNITFKDDVQTWEKIVAAVPPIGTTIVGAYRDSKGTGMISTIENWAMQADKNKVNSDSESNKDGQIDDTPSEKHETQEYNKDGQNSLSPKGEANSSKDLLNEDGSVKQRRWYDNNGDAYRDIDYNHADDGTHTFPHEHKWINGYRN